MTSTFMALNWAEWLLVAWALMLAAVLFGFEWAARHAPMDPFEDEEVYVPEEWSWPKQDAA